MTFGKYFVSLLSVSADMTTRKLIPFASTNSGCVVWELVRSGPLGGTLALKGECLADMLATFWHLHAAVRVVSVGYIVPRGVGVY